MAWSFCGHARLGADAALREVLPEDGVASRVSVLEWSAEGAREILDRELRASAAVVVIAEDDAAEREALELGASEVVRWPASGATLAARVRRATYVVRLPWLESVLRMVDDSVEMTDPEIHLLEVNPAFERITGYSREEALGKTTGELFRSENQDPSFYRADRRDHRARRRVAGTVHRAGATTARSRSSRWRSARRATAGPDGRARRGQA